MLSLSGSKMPARLPLPARRTRHPSKLHMAALSRLTVLLPTPWARATSLTPPPALRATVHDIWLSAAKSVYAWAVENKLTDSNPFAGVKITVPRKVVTRDRAFTPTEAKTILAAASAIEPKSAFTAAQRWCPWLAGYSGARMGEITQLRGGDVRKPAKPLRRPSAPPVRPNSASGRRSRTPTRASATSTSVPPPRRPTRPSLLSAGLTTPPPAPSATATSALPAALASLWACATGKP